MAKRRKVEYEEGTVECFYCGKPVYENSWRCHNCGKWFREGRLSILGIIAMIVIVIALILYITQPSFVFGGESEETEKRYGILLTVGPGSNKVEPGGYTEWGIQMTSLSNVADNYELGTVNATQLQVSFSSPIVGLTSGQQLVNVLRIDVPIAAELKPYDFEVYAISKSDPTASYSIDLTVEVVDLGTRTVQTDDNVQCHYIFWTQDDGVLMESSYQRDETLKVAVSGQPEGDYIAVLPGFSEGLLGMKAGETRVVFVPPAKGYQDPNDANTGQFVGRVLIYQIQLVRIDTA